MKPARKWNLFVVPHQHLDIGYTHYPPKVSEVQSRAIDQAIDMIREHLDFYTLHAGWVAEQFLAGRSRGAAPRIPSAHPCKEDLRARRLRSHLRRRLQHRRAAAILYPCYRLNRENGGDFDKSTIDLPSHSWSYPSAMAAAGLKYLVLPANQDLGPILLRGNPHLNEKTPFWREGPDGQRILTWYSGHYHQAQSLFALPPNVEAGRDSLPTFLRLYAGRTTHPMPP